MSLGVTLRSDLFLDEVVLSLVVEDDVNSFGGTTNIWSKHDAIHDVRF